MSCFRWWGVVFGVAVAWAGPIAFAAGEAPESADAIARELTNPNNDLAKLTFKNQYRWYTGDLPGADSQANYSMLFQPIFPFSSTDESGQKRVFFLRPAIPFLYEQPYFDSGALQFDDTTQIGDISFDAAYGVTTKTGWAFLAGTVQTLPTGTSDKVAGGQLRMGPELLIGKVWRSGVLAAFPYHQWDVTGWGGTKEARNAGYSTTSTQIFALRNLGGGWTIGTQPILQYNHKSEDWTVPVELYVAKTVKLGKTPVRFELQVDYYVEQEDAFGPEWLVSFNFTPVVSNFVEGWFRK